MRKTNLISETAIELANKIEHQIHETNLAKGTPYKKTALIAKEYGVSTSCANLAMRLLVQRKIVERRPRAGTFIADYHHDSLSPVDKIHFMMPGTSTGIPSELLRDLLLGLQSVFPQAKIGFTYYEHNATGTGGEPEIGELVKGKANQALILVRAPLYLQRLISESRLPCVVLGHPFPTVNLPWVDVDSARQGELAASCILDHPNAPALLLMQNRIAPGDHLFMEGFKEKLRSGKWELSRLTERFVPADEKVIAYTVKEYLRKHSDPCTIIVPISAVDLTLKTIKQLKEGKRVSVVSIRGINSKLQSAEKSTIIGWEINLYELGVKLGELLLARVTNGSTNPGKSIFSPQIIPPAQP